MLEAGDGDSKLEQVPLSRVRIDMHEPRRIFKWQRAQEKIIDQTEDRGIQSDPEREREGGNDSEAGRFAELAQRES
jgi:hypothetical protein